jgi:hypothetical protein
MRGILLVGCYRVSISINKNCNQEFSMGWDATCGMCVQKRIEVRNVDVF